MHSKPGEPADLTETRGFPPVTVIAPPAHADATAATTFVTAPAPAAPAELAGMLLPTERVTFASSPHPIVFVRPVAEFVVLAAALMTALGWQTHPVVHGHHVTVALLAALRVVGLALARTWRYFGYRVVTTNRRAFVIEGVLGRRVRPLGNTGMAGATMWQSLLGRMLGFGTVVVGGDARSMRQMKDPVRLYREFEAIANGVDGDTWTPAVRQTLIP